MHKKMNETLVPPAVLLALRMLEAAGFNAYIVGGAVRDYLRGVPAKDWDIATSALPSETKQLFSGYKTLLTGEEYGTVTVVIDGMPLEVTTFRVDGAYADARHPQSVQFSADIKADLARRDFTMNAIAYSPVHGWQDPFGGVQDIQNGIIRCVGDAPTRLSEDALRILRAVRFAAQTGFTVSEETAAAMHEQAAALSKVSPERLFAELEKAVYAPHVKQAFSLFSEVVACVVPELRDTFGFEQNSIYHKYDVWTHTLESLALTPAGEHEVRFCVLFHDISKPACCVAGADGHRHFRGHPEKGVEITRGILQRLKAPKKFSARVLDLILLHDVSLADTKTAVGEILVNYGEEFMRQLLLVKTADTLTHSEVAVARRTQENSCAQSYFAKVLEEGHCFSLKCLAVNANDLTPLGYSGVQLGETLRALLLEVACAREENDKEALIAWALENMPPRTGETNV